SCFDGANPMLSLARRFCSYSARKFHGKRFHGVAMLLSQMKSAYSKPETNARVRPVPVPTMSVALVMALVCRNAEGVATGLGKGVPAAGVFGCKMQVVWPGVLVEHSPTGETACATGSAPFQFSTMIEGVVFHGP